MNSDKTGVDFENKIIDTKMMNIFSYRNFYNGAGVGVGDINNDGLPDIFLISNLDENKLFLNEGNFKFKDISKSSKTEGTHAWSTGVAMVDINNDGFLDIYVSNAGNKKGDNRRNELFINNKDLTFTESAAKYGLDEDGFTTQTTFFDYDGDGDLDAYILNNSFIPVNSLNYVNKRNLRDKDWPLPELFKGGGDKLLRNDNGKFVDVSEQAGIYGSLIGFGLGVTVGDFNNDLLPDIYVCNDFYEHDYMYINQGNGTFKEELENQMQHLTMSSMGADIADINNDGHQDLYVNDMLQEGDKRLKNLSDFESYSVHQLKLKRDFHYQYMQNTLQLNNANNTFSEIAFLSNVAQTDWSWATLVFDMDNDGYKDIFVTNGLYHDLTNQDFLNYFANGIIQKMALTGKKEEINFIINKMPSTPIENYAFKNNHDLTFTNMANKWGLDKKTFSNGAAYADFDNDGDLDIIVNNVNQKTLIYENTSDKKLNNNYLKTKLIGDAKNRFAIGTRVKLYYKDQIFDQECMPVRGFQSSVDYVLNFGLGKITQLDSLTVIWPNKKMQTLKNVAANQSLTLKIIDANSDVIPELKSNQKTLFQKVNKLSFIKHNEDVYNDFEFEGMIPEKLSKQGPAIAVGDVNNDGFDDVYIGGAYEQAGHLYLQDKKGRFKLSKFSAEVFFEDTFAVFVDIDNDKDLDLIVGSGGNFKNARTGVRAYINDGKGLFGDYKIIAHVNANIATIKPYDFDSDGDIDLFVGSLSIPQIYGMNPENMLLENNGNGTFKNVTISKARKIKNLGMITDASWQDMDSDGIKDLVIVGKWMSPIIFKNDGSKLTELKTNLNKISGDFTALKVADIDNDGDFDIILGNRGDNSFYKADSTHVAKMFVNDFDNNGTIEQVFTRTIDNKDVPVHLLKELNAQITSIKNKHYTFTNYAKMSINDLFSKEILNKSLIKKINTFKSIVLLNNHNKFTVKPLPIRAQMSTIKNIMVLDLNKDGNLDLITTGNNYNYKTQYTRQDASYGDVYFGDGKGDFTWQAPQKTGFFIKGQINSMNLLKGSKNQNYILLGPNNEAPQMFKWHE
ncbi:MAG: VCBS repeat-containing protein [Flavobacteriaceae bacterium]